MEQLADTMILNRRAGELAGAFIREITLASGVYSCDRGSEAERLLDRLLATLLQPCARRS